MEPRCEIEATEFDVRFYTDHEDNYSSSFTMKMIGDAGHITKLNGREFFSVAARFFDYVLGETGAEFMTAELLAHTLRALKKTLEGVATIEVTREFKKKGRKFFQVKIQRIQTGI